MNRKSIILTNIKNEIVSLPASNVVNRSDFETQIMKKIDRAVGNRANLTNSEKIMINNLSSMIIQECRGNGRNYHQIKNQSTMNNHENHSSVAKAAVLNVIEDFKNNRV